MPPPLPNRFRLEVRLGRDGDIEEWLATDTDLDRPVLIRALGPDTSVNRRERFLTDVRRASSISHTHVAAVYMADSTKDGAFAVTEWAGGVTLADRLQAEETPPTVEFLSNAAGLAEGLAALHDAKVIHGTIDPSAILYARAHPAKLGAFGRKAHTWSEVADVQALGATLETALTGQAAGVLPPSQMIDGLHPDVDRALRLAQQGAIGAGELADRIRSIPYTAPPEPTRSWNWRWLIPVAGLAAAAAVIAALGAFLGSGSSSPILFPATPTPTEAPAVPTTTTITLPPTSIVPGDPVPIAISRALAYDPLGDGSEHDDDVANLLDGDTGTTWRTERYFDPLPRLKAGVGIAFEVVGTPVRLELVDMSPGATFEVGWSETTPSSPGSWETVASGRGLGGTARIQLPPRPSGTWVIWFTDLPPQDEGFFAGLSEVRFRSE